ncbi:MAG: glycoside hydrolase [Planctomycetaceae bacterium]|jgi:hypothetical protein|nr:glycoside hydrolase [Planctomycetaceae bacterium]
MKKIFVLTLLAFLFFPFTVSAQQNPDVNVWVKEYEGRIKNVTESRQKQKPNFQTDLQFSKPDYVVFVPEVEPEKLGDMYNDHFQVFDKPNGKLFAVWCQASVEGALDQHVAFSQSNNKGKTWEKPRVLAGNKTVAEGIANKGTIASWAFPLVSKSGRIYILYNQFVPGKVSTNRQHTGIMMGIYSDDDGETWTAPEEIAMPRTSNDGSDPSIPPEWVVWQKPTRVGKNGNYLVGVSRYVHPNFHSKYRTVTEFIHFDNVDQNPSIKNLAVRWVMTDDKVLHSGVHCEEPAIVKLPDGRLFVVMRSGTGSPLWSVSSDDGETWAAPKPLLMKDGGDPIPHPMSPCPIYDWKGNEAAGGLYFLMAHNRYDKWNPNPWQNRGPLYLFAGRYQKDAEQPVWFDGPKKFIERKSGNSFYTSTTLLDGKTVLWYNDQKFYLLGRVIGENFFDGQPDTELYNPNTEIDLSSSSPKNHADGKPIRLGISPKLELKNGAEQGIFKQGETIFKNRNYTVIQCPKELNGKKFVRSNIESVEAVCRENGIIYVLTPLKDRNSDSVAETLLKLGFEKVAQPETLLFERIPDAIVTLYQKEVKAGETIKLGKWSLLIY